MSNLATFEIKTVEETETEIEWVNWYDTVKTEGDTYELVLNRVSYNEEKGAIYLIGEETGTTVYTQHHENAKFKTGMTHGIRVVNSFARMLKLSGTIEADSLFDAVAAKMTDATLTITANKTAKGVLWTVV